MIAVVSADNNTTSSRLHVDDKACAKDPSSMFKLPTVNSVKTPEETSDTTRTEVIDLNVVLPAFLKYENTVWQETVNSSVFRPGGGLQSQLMRDGDLEEEQRHTRHSSSSEASFSEQSHTWSTLGEALLKHSQFLDEIHDYFIKLDCRRCCIVNETMLGGDHTQGDMGTGRMKVLNRSISMPEKQAKGKKRRFSLLSKSKSKLTVPSLHLLSNAEKDVYKYAIQCAHFPVLCSPNAPQPSPFLSPPTSPSQSEQSAQCPSSPTDSLAIERESLFLLLRNAFELTIAVHEMYEKDVLRRKGNSYNAAMELLKELNNRRVLLEENRHPMYKLSAFLFADGYEKWRTKEITTVRQLTRRLCSLPASSLPVCNKLDIVNTAACYTILESKLTKQEMTQRMNCCDISEDYMISDSPLSTASKRLLKEFALRYGVGEVYRKVSSMKCLASNFALSTWFIKCTTQAVQSSLKLLEAQYQVFLKMEHDMLVEALDDLLNRGQYILKRLGMLCPRFISFDGVDALVNLLGAVQKVQIALGEWTDEDLSLHDLLTLCIKSAAKKSYKTIKTLALIDYEPMAYNAKLSPKVLRRILHDMREQLKLFSSLHDSCYNLQSYLNVSRIATREFYTLFTKDVKEVIVSRTETTQTASVDYELLGLAYKLAKLDEEWKVHINVSDQRWRLYFILEARIITKSITEHSWKLVKGFVQGDKEAVLLASAESQMPQEVPKDSQRETPLSTSEHGLISSTILVRSMNSAFQSVSTIDKTWDVSSIRAARESSVSGTDSCASNERTNQLVRDSQISEEESAISSLPQPDAQEGNTPQDGTSLYPDLMHLQAGSNATTEKLAVIRDVSCDDHCNPADESEDKELASFLDVHRQQHSPNRHSERPSIAVVSLCSNRCDIIKRSLSDSELHRTKRVVHAAILSSLQSTLESGEIVRTRCSSLCCCDLSSSFQEEFSKDSEDKSARKDSYLSPIAPPSLRSRSPSSCGNSKNSSQKSVKDDAEPDLNSNQFFSACDPSDELCDRKLLVTSSLVDTTVTIVHLLRFCGEICDLLAPRHRFPDSKYALASGEKEAFEVTYAIRKDICRELIKSIGAIFRVYADNVLALDLCGLSNAVFKQQLSKQVSKHMVEMVKRGLLCGCRHLKGTPPEVKATKSEVFFQSCSWLKKKQSYAFVGWERVTPQTCFRISNVFYACKMLGTLQTLCCELCNVEVLAFHEDDDLFYDSEKERTKLADVADRKLCLCLASSAHYLTAVNRHQITLLVSRVVRLFSSVLCELMKLRPKADDSGWKQHLLPLKNILEKHLKLFEDNLNTILKDEVVTKLSDEIVAVFSIQVDQLASLSTKLHEKATGLWQALILSCEILSINEETCSQMAMHVNALGLRLEVFTMSSADLGNLLHLVDAAKNDESSFIQLSMTEVVSSLQSLANGHVTGAQLKAYLAERPLMLDVFSDTLHFDSSPLSNGEKVLRIGQYLLDTSIIQCIEIPYALCEIRQPGFVVVRSPPADKLSPAVLLSGSRISFDGQLSPEASSDDTNDSDHDSNVTEMSFIESFHGNPWLTFLPLDNAVYISVRSDKENVPRQLMEDRLKEIVRSGHQILNNLERDCLSVLDSRWLLLRDTDAFDTLSGIPDHFVRQRCSCPF